MINMNGCLKNRKSDCCQYRVNKATFMLEPDVTLVPSPNFGKPFESGYPDLIIIHYTAMDSAESAITRLTSPEFEVSAHLVIARDGFVSQLVPFSRIAWHAGKSEWKNRQSINKYSIGIELDNAGLLQKRGDHYFSESGRKYPETEVVKNEESGRTTFWHSYPDCQMAELIKICRLLKEEFNIKEILGHSDISPQRKIDPGPAFPMERLRMEVLM